VICSESELLSGIDAILTRYAESFWAGRSLLAADGLPKPYWMAVEKVLVNRLFNMACGLAELP